MKKNKIIYWVLTGLMCFGLGLGAVFNAMSSPESVELISHHLGFPPYMVPFVGVAKLCAIAVILMPGLSRLKEWAYAGLVYDLVGAIYSHISIGAPASEWAPIFILILFIAGSYVFHHKLLKAPSSLS